MDATIPDNVWYFPAENLQIFKTIDGGATVNPAYTGSTDAGSVLSAAFIASFAFAPASAGSYRMAEVTATIPLPEIKAPPG